MGQKGILTNNQHSFNPQIILETIENWSKKYKFTIQTQYNEPNYNYFLNFEDKEILKVDFVRYPYKQLEKINIFDNLKVDSLFDIAVNKLLTINQRTEVKDFVDMYFLLQQFNFWQLKDGVKAKFNIDLEPFLMAADFTKTEGFEIMPRMIKKLELQELKNFFKNQAIKLGSSSIK